MKKVLILQGIPSSGKTTWAKEFLNKDNNSETWVRISRDDLRNMLGVYWIPSREKLVSEYEDTLFDRALQNNKNVIIDATNLNPKTIAKFENVVAKINQEYINFDNKKQYEIEYKFFDITPEEAVLRDSKRERPVGEKVIIDFWKKYIRGKKDAESYIRKYVEYNPKLPECIIVDIDGTVALMNGRSPYDGSKVDTDLPNVPVIDLVLNTVGDRNYPTELIFMSGRAKNSEELTRNWIDKYIISRINDYNLTYQLYMRESDDWRKDSIVKKELYEKYVKDKYNVNFVLDDRDQTVKGWRDLGLLCLQVYYGNF